MAHLYIILALQILLVVSVPLLLLRALVQILSDRTDVPFVKTSEDLFPRIASALDIQPFDVVYELGSGDGAFSLWCARTYPNAKFVGVEQNPLLYAWAQWHARHSGMQNISFVRENLFHMNLSGARKIYCYLIGHVMDRLLPKLEQEFHGRVASRAFRFSAKKAEETIELSKKTGSYGQHLLHIYDF